MKYLLCLLSCKSGESPARSRQNSSSSLGSTNLASSMFSHRQTSSSSTQQDTPTLPLKASKIGSSRLNSASTTNTSSTVQHDSGTSANTSTLPSIRGYTSFPDAVHLSSTRPRTPLLDPFMRSHGSQPTTARYANEAYASNEPPRLGPLSDEPGPSNSYVAALALAPLVSRPTQGGQPLYIAGGRTPDTLHAAPSSTYSTPNLHTAPSMQFTGSNHTMPKLTAAVPPTGSDAATRTGTLNSNAGLGLTPSTSAGQTRPGMRHRSSSVDSYLRHDNQQDLEDDGADGHRRRHERQHSSGLAGLSNFFHLRSSNSEDKGGSLSRRRTSKSRSRKGSLSNTVNTGQSAKLSSRFVHYGQPSPASRPRTPQSETRVRQRSSSFGAVAPQSYQFPERESPTHPGIGSAAQPRGRLPRGYDTSRSNSAVTASSSLGKRKEEKRVRNKLISARLPDNIHHKDARLPSQPLGYTWICGSSSAARTPSFYEEFDYSDFPGGKRKRSMSRSTITQRNYATTGASNSRTASRAGQTVESEDLAYESEPEFLARRRARDAADGGRKSGAMVDEQTQTGPIEALYSSKVQIPHLAFPTGGGALLTNQEEEKALRRRSQSLVNLRRAYSQNSHGSSKQRDGRDEVNHGNLLISHPYREHSNEFVRTPRAAPVPFPDDDYKQGGFDSGVPPLFMGESVVVPECSARRDGAGHYTRTESKTVSVANLALAGSVRRTPSRASIEAVDDPEKRKEALFAALPPPARRSPTPASVLSPNMYTTSEIISSESSTTPAFKARESGYMDYAVQHDSQYSNSGINGSGTISPPVDDFSQFEASRVIIGQSDLLSSATAQERFPVVYGQAFSTTHESQEGEILNASSSADSLSAMARQQREESRELNNYRDSLTPLREVETSMAMHRGQDTSGSGGSGSASRSISNGSARILDLNEESFTNLVSIANLS